MSGPFAEQIFKDRRDKAAVLTRSERALWIDLDQVRRDLEMDIAIRKLREGRL